MNDEEPFLSRWSRLKRGDAPPKPEAAEKHEPRQPAPEPVPTPEQEPLDLTKLPRLEDIAADTDIRAFLDPRVPGELRNEALRRAWRLDPVIDTFVEVAENQYDWNTPGGVPGYGPLGPVPDLPKLLAQATGKLFEEPADMTVTTVHDIEETPFPPAQVMPTEPESATALQEAAVPAPTPALLTSGEDPAPQALAVLPDASATTLEPTRRRHGTALPR